MRVPVVNHTHDHTGDVAGTHDHDHTHGTLDPALLTTEKGIWATAVQNNLPFSILPASMLRVRRRSI